QQSDQAHKSQAHENGAAKERPPISRLSLNFSRITRGSTSAPARKVRRMLPNDARKSIHGGLVRPRKFPATTPRLISISATDTPSSTEATLARRPSRPELTDISRVSIRPP